MKKMIVSYDTSAEATYVTFLVDAVVARTHSVSDLVMVDLDANDAVIGVEFVVPPERITDVMLGRLADFRPDPFKAMAHDRSWLLTHAS